ncbi:MAG: hypothetical protein AUI14_05950 [Actinobacteria bacterium 13_2_20CM_2_71_6]|nr:MAG: hypothetical protein AUI14_05950 [Actinobacteria bacterium 13_2_20CM_2_71_6]
MTAITSAPDSAISPGFSRGILRPSRSLRDGMPGPFQKSIQRPISTISAKIQARSRPRTWASQLRTSASTAKPTMALVWRGCAGTQTVSQLLTI